MVTVAVARPPTGTSDARGSTDVQVDRSLGVWPAAPRNEPLTMVAAEGYKEYVRACESVVFESSISRSITVPGAT